MADKRPVDELSVEELERILAIKKRGERQTRLQRMKDSGRVVEVETSPNAKANPPRFDEPLNVQLPAESVQKRKSVPQFEEALETTPVKQKKQAEGERLWRAFMERSLFFLEAAAVIGLVVLGIALFNGVNLLQEETADAQRAAESFRSASIPTLEPTPQLRLANVVLPTGHIIQNGVAQFNFNEIPEHLRWQVANQVFLPVDIARPPVTDETPLRVLIPALSIDKAIVQGIDWDALQQGVGMLTNGATPTMDDANIVLAAHNDIYGEIFRRLDELQAGDQLQIQTRSGIYTYAIQTTLYVAPDDVHVMNPQGAPMVTLISCYPYQVNNQRIVVYAYRVDA